MAEKKKKQRAEFAEDKNVFAGRSSAKEDTAAKRAKQKQSGAHQPRDVLFVSLSEPKPPVFLQIK